MVKCNICKQIINGEYFESNEDKPTIVCSDACKTEYLCSLPYNGSPIQHWSRITGYYQNVSGWNKGKRQELTERRRYGI